MKKNILVTGGAGFVGSHLVDALLAAGHRVRILDNLDPQVHGDNLAPQAHGELSLPFLQTEAELVVGDMRDPEAVRRALEGMEVVFHLAAAVGVGQSMYEIAHYMGSNTQGTAILLQEMLHGGNRIEKLIVASSMSIYGEGGYVCVRCAEEVAPLPRSAAQVEAREWEMSCPRCAATLDPVPTRESKPLQCGSIYALSKKDQEEMCLLYGRTYRIPVVALRYFNIYGPRQALSNPYTGVAAIFASRLLNGNPPLVFEDGKQMRDFVSVHDVARANLLALERTEADGFALNIGSGEPVSILQVAAELSRALDKDGLVELTGRRRAGDVRHCFADISAASRLLGYKPRIGFAQGCADLAVWLRSQTPRDRVQEAAAQLRRFGLTA